MKTNEERVRDLLGYLGSLSHVTPAEIPDKIGRASCRERV